MLTEDVRLPRAVRTSRGRRAFGIIRTPQAKTSPYNFFATVTNFGTIDGLNHVAIFAFTDVNVTNGAGGQITSLINNGIYASNGVATVVNSGNISVGGLGYAIRARRAR